MAKKMRTINNPLDRQTRNDINYNFGVLDNALEDMANSEAADNERFTRIENDVTKLKKEDKNLSDRIDANKQAIEDMDLDAIKLQGDTAEKQGIEAKKKGDKAEQQGNLSEQKGNVAEEQGIVSETKGIKAEQQGNYAKEMGDYAKEKAEYASAKTSEIEQAHTDLSQIKVEAVDATQNANTQADRAKQEADRAKPLVDKIESELPNIENLKHVGEWASGKAYKKNEEVLYNGSSYRAKRNNTGKTPSSNTADWQLIAQRGVDGKGAVGSVNDIKPDAEGNVSLGKFDVGLGNVQNYEVANTEEATAGTLNNKYMTPKGVLESIVSNASNATVIDYQPSDKWIRDYPHQGVTVFFKNPAVTDEGYPSPMGTVTTVTASRGNTGYQIFIRNGNGLANHKTFIRYYHFQSRWSKWYELPHSEDINPSATIIERQASDLLPKSYPDGTSVFYTDIDDAGYPHRIGTVVNFKNSDLTSFQLFARNGYNTESKYMWYRTGHTQAGWSEWFKITDSRDFSNSTTSDSSDTVATSKAVKYLNDALIGTDDSLRQTQRDLQTTNDNVAKAQQRADEAFRLGDSTKKNIVQMIKYVNTDSNVSTDSDWGTIADDIHTMTKIADNTLKISGNQQYNLPYSVLGILPTTTDKIMVTLVIDGYWRIFDENSNLLADIMSIGSTIDVKNFKKEFTVRLLGHYHSIPL